MIRHHDEFVDLRAGEAPAQPLPLALYHRPGRAVTHLCPYDTPEQIFPPLQADRYEVGAAQAIVEAGHAERAAPLGLLHARMPVEIRWRRGRSEFGPIAVRAGVFG